MPAILILLLCLGQQAAPAVDQPVPKLQGSIEYINGHCVVNLWGTHFGMGYAHGYLLGDKIMLGFEEVVLRLWVTPAEYEALWLKAARQDFFLPPEYELELEGMFRGMKDAGTDLHVEKLYRDLTLDDLFALNLAMDLYNMSCSASFAWGSATAADPEIQGGSLVVHNWEEAPDPSGILQSQATLFVFQSSSPEEMGFVSISGPGLIMVGTGINAAGVGAVVNGSTWYIQGEPPPEGFYGLGFAVRDGLEDRDFDGDGHETHLDVFEAIRRHTMLNSHDIGLVSPYPVPGHPNLGSAAIVEVNYTGCVLRDATNNLDHPPYLNSSDLLAVTSHHRLLYPPIYCHRYQYQVDRMSIDFKVDTEELWNIQCGISYPNTHMMTAMRPNLLDMFVAFNETLQGAAYSRRNYYKLSDLFPNH